MDIIKEPYSNYLNHSHYKRSLKVAFTWPLACLLVSSYYWNYSPSSLHVTKSLIFTDYEFWRLPLGLLAHEDLNHFLSNSLFLSLLSYLILKAYGPKILFALGFLLGITSHALTLYIMTDNVSLLGASGLVYCLWGFCLSLYFLIDRFTSITRKLMKITAITILLLIPHSYQANVSYLAHSLGFLLGILAGICVFSIYKNKFRSFESYRYVLDPPQNPAFDELKDDFWKTE